MSHWNYTNVGASAKPENKRYVEKIFEYIGYNPDSEYNDYDKCSFYKPDIYYCEYSAYEPFSGKIKSAFKNMQHEELLDLLNALFPNTDVYIHSAEGNDTNDTWENHNIVYDTNDMTCRYDSFYTSYDCGPSGKRSHKERFALKPPQIEYVSALIDLSTADGNGELTALLIELSRKLKEGLIVYKDDPEDKREIGKPYDDEDNVTGEDKWDEYEEKSEDEEEPEEEWDEDEEEPKESTLADFRMVKYGHYPQMEDGTDSTPIEWLVLEVDEEKHRALLLSRHGLDSKSYNDEDEPVTWETCTLRTWLNEAFLDAAFTDREQSFILQTQTDNSKSQGNSEWDDSDGGNDTKDRIFLLSFAEAMNYFENDSVRRCAATPYAVAQGAVIDDGYVVDGIDSGWWWLRSPGYDQSFAALVDFDGSLDDQDIDVPSDGGCVRPAFWINLESDIF